MKKFLNIISNELKHFLKDKGALLIMIIGVIAYSLCYSVPYYHEIIKEVPIGMIDFDQSTFSQKFTRDINATDSIKIYNSYMSMAEAEKTFYRDQIKGFIVIPQNFERDILRGKQVNVLYYGDSAYLIIYKSVYSQIVNIAMETGAKIEIAKIMKQGISKRQAIAIKQPFKFVQIPLYNSIGGYMSYVYPIILILILHQTFLLGLGLIQGTRNERHRKYCQNDDEIPLNIFAKTTMYILLYSIYAITFYLIYPVIFKYPIHYNLPVIIMFLLMMYSAGFFAQTISYFFKTRETAILIMVSSSLILIFIPGLIWPREAIPQIINWISFFIPATCGIDGIIKLNQNNATFINILYDYYWLIFLNIFYYITAIFATRKMNQHCNINKNIRVK